MSYFDNAGRTDVLGGGERMVPITTPAGQHRVWTKRTGNNPATKMLLLHGGPGATHEYLLGFDSFLPGAGVEYYYYDQLGSGWSDQPDEPSLWTIERFVDEVEQVRLALGLTRENFVLYGQSWGGILAIEYALAHQEHLKGLVISNMMASIPAYNAYANDVLIPARTRTRSPRSRRSRPRATPTTRATTSCSCASTTSSTCSGCRSRTGPSRSCARSRASTRTSTSRSRARASSAPAAC